MKFNEDDLEKTLKDFQKESAHENQKWVKNNPRDACKLLWYAGAIIRCIK